jgi:hypothetical protein
LLFAFVVAGDEAGRGSRRLSASTSSLLTPGFEVQQLQLIVAELLAFRPVFADQLKTQPLFQRLNFQAGPLQFLRQKDDLFGFGAEWMRR